MFWLKKGPADPFRGDWYTDAIAFNDIQAATEEAMRLTFTDYEFLGTSWEQFGYEWSVFETVDGEDMKRWEGYRCIQCMLASGSDQPVLDQGWME